MPSLFKERLFVYLSRFCEVRYCIVRHCATTRRRRGRQTAAQAIRLLKALPPWRREFDDVLDGLEAGRRTRRLPAPAGRLHTHLRQYLYYLPPEWVDL
jgi:hypothetical protein